MSFRFSSRFLFLLTTMVAVHLAIRKVANFQNAQFILLALAVLSAVYIQYTQSQNRIWKRAINGSIAGGLVVAISAMLLGVEMLEGLRRASDSEYWNWTRDWPAFVMVIIIESGCGAIVGAIVAAFPIHLCVRCKN